MASDRGSEEMFALKWDRRRGPLFVQFAEHLGEGEIERAVGECELETENNCLTLCNRSLEDPHSVDGWTLNMINHPVLDWASAICQI